MKKLTLEQHHIECQKLIDYAIATDIETEVVTRKERKIRREYKKPSKMDYPKLSGVNNTTTVLTSRST